MLIKTLYIWQLFHIGIGKTFYHWQCSLLSNSTIQSLVEQNAEAFQVIGWPEWMIMQYKSINCAQRGLKNVPQGLNNKIEILDLGRNSITHIREKDFATYHNLVAISLIRNCIIANFYAVSTPRCSTYLTIEKGAMSNLQNLRYLSLSSTAMKQFPELLPRNIRVLLSSFASLSPVQKKHLNRLPSLEFVSFSANCLVVDVKHFCARRFTIASKVFSSSHLKLLDLGYNNFTSVPSYLFQQSLIGIRLKGNPLNWVRSSDFENATNIKYLNVAWTAQYIKTPLQIEMGSFDMLRKLEVLDLSTNMISSLPKDFLSQNAKLKSLNLEFNCLKMIEVDPAILPPLPLLEELSLGGNTFCSDTLNPVKNFQKRLDFTEACLRFPNLTTLSLGKFMKFDPPMYLMYGSNYDRVDGHSFQFLRNLSQLKNLEFVACGIRVLDTAAFKGFNISNVELQINQIGEVSNNRSNHDNNFRVKRHDSFQKTTNQLHAILDLKEFHIYEDIFHKNSLDNKKNSKACAVNFSRNAIYDLQLYPLKYFTFSTHLDLSRNKINYIPKDVFQHMINLQVLDLRFNPIRFIHPEALIPLARLMSLQFNLTEFEQDFSVKFLLGAQQSLTLKYGDTGGHFYRLLKFYADQSVNFSKIVSLDLSYISIPHYFVSKNQPIFKPLPNLTSLKIDGAQMTFHPQSNFFSGIIMLHYLSMRECWLEEFPYLALKPLQDLRYLDLSHNKIEVLNMNMNIYLIHLETLILSHNYIYIVAPGIMQLFLNNGMQKFDVSFNQIKNIDPPVINRYAVQEMELDLRGNTVRCDCSLGDTFGWLIQSNKLNNSKLPGFLPDCSSSVMNYYGGCIACDQSTSDKPLSLFTYTITNNCWMHFLIYLAVSFNGVFLLSLVLALSSTVLKRKLLSFLLRDVSVPTIPNPPKSSVYAYDGFVFYDRNNLIVGDWVDSTLISRFASGNPSFYISVVGKEEWCGMTQVQQVLLQMRASRKTIVIFSDDFFSNPQCQYVLSVLEEWIYTNKEDKCILIAFDYDETNCSQLRVFRKGSRRTKHTMLKYERLEDNPLFWDVLTNAMTSFN